MNEIKIFENEQFGKIRTTGTADNPLFCLSDICKVLELRVDGVMPRLKKDGYNRIGVIDSLGRHQEAIFVNEQNLYKVIMRSDKPQAEPFQDWVCGEVLPSIRKTGGYIVSTPEMTNEEIMARALIVANETIKKRNEQLALLNGNCNRLEKKVKSLSNVNAMLEDENAFRKECNIKDRKEKAELSAMVTYRDIKIDKLNGIIEEQKPKVDSYDRFINADGTYDIECVSQMLCFKNIGQKNLFKVLRELKILNKNNGPYQKYVNSGYFKVLPKTRKSKITETYIPYWQTVVYPKGVEYIKKKLIEAGFEFQVNK